MSKAQFLANRANNFASVEDYGAVGNGIVDDSNAFITAISALGVGGTLLATKNYFLTQPLTLPNYFTIQGDNYFMATTGLPQSQIKFALTGTQIAITGGLACVIKDICLHGPSASGTVTGLYVTGGNDVLCHNVVFTAWGYSSKLVASDYSRFFNCDFHSNNIGISITQGYNIHTYGCTFTATNTAYNIVDYCRPLSIFGGSIESFNNGGGIYFGTGYSVVNVNGVYFESSGTSGGFGIQLAANSTLNITGCEVYLSNLNRFINASGLNAVNIYSRNNRFVCSSGSTTPYAYFLPTNGTSGSVDIAGDSWTPGEITQSANYTDSNTWTSSAARSNFNIVPPTELAAASGAHSYLGRPIALPILTAAPATPVSGAVYAADKTNWNPLGHNIGPYLCMYNAGGGSYVEIGDDVNVSVTATTAANSITPTGKVFHVTGATPIQYIVVPYSGFIGSRTIIPDSAYTTITGGNIGIASTAVVGKIMIMTFDGTKWYPSY